MTAIPHHYFTAIRPASAQGEKSCEAQVIDLNRAERRALLVSTLLVVLATAGRTALTPGREVFAWRPAGGGSPEQADLPALRRDVVEALRREERAHTPLATGERIDPNSASVEELRRLPGIGPTRATAIVAQRAVEPFRHRGDLLRVAGIGAATLARVAPHLSLPEARGPSDLGLHRSEGWTAPPSHHPTPPGCTSRTAVSSPRVDLNRADSAALVTLPTIGPARAGRILRYRARRGGFEAVDELLAVPGIGPGTLERLRTLVCVG